VTHSQNLCESQKARCHKGELQRRQGFGNRCWAVDGDVPVHIIFGRFGVVSVIVSDEQTRPRRLYVNYAPEKIIVRNQETVYRRARSRVVTDHAEVVDKQIGVRFVGADYITRMLK
jgi:hypothetical protein